MSIDDSVNHEREILLEEERYLMEKIKSKNPLYCLMAIFYKSRLDRLKNSSLYRSYITNCKKPSSEQKNSPLR